MRWQETSRLALGPRFRGLRPTLPDMRGGGELKTVQQAERASGQEIHQTLSLLLAMLPLQPAHRNHLHSPKRGLSDEQIDRIGFKSTPPPFPLPRHYRAADETGMQGGGGARLLSG